MRVELNEQIKERLEAIALLMKTEKRVPRTAYFPFIVCFEWVNPFGMLVKSEVQNKRVLLCEAYNSYLQEEAKSKINTSKVRLSAFMTAKMKK